MSGFGRTPTGFRAWVRVSSRSDDFDELRTKRFPRGTSKATIRAWRTAERARLTQRLEQQKQRTAAPGTFRADAERYLAAVTAMPSYTERVRDIGVWVDAFGDRPRASIQPLEIRTLRDQWLTVGPRRCWQKVNGVGQWIDVAAPLAGPTVNHRLRALSNLWTVLDGRRAPNPVREVPEADEAEAVPRALDYQTIRQILAAMSDQGQALKGKGNRRTFSLAKVRAQVMAWTGVTPTELMKIAPGDLHWEDTFLVVPARRKGRGAPGRLVPLGPEALAALRAFDAQAAYGRFERRVVLRAWQRACRAVLGRSVRLYDLRHSFVTGIVRATKNLGTAQLLAGHTDPRTTRRYALSAILPTLRAGIDAFTASVKEEKPS